MRLLEKYSIRAVRRAQRCSLAVLHLRTSKTLKKPVSQSFLGEPNWKLLADQSIINQTWIETAGRNKSFQRLVFVLTQLPMQPSSVFFQSDYDFGLPDLLAL